MAAKDNKWLILNAVKESGGPVGAVYLSGVLGISSANIGRILAELEAQGLVAKIRNKGRDITDAGRRYLEETAQKNRKILVASQLIDAASARNGKDLRDILLVRCLLEGYTAEACAKNISGETLKELEDIQFDYAYEVRHDRTGSELDLKFHLKIAQIAASPAISRILDLILTDEDNYVEFTRAAIGSQALYYDEHDSILKAIREKDGAAARREMECHLKRVMENVENYFG